MAKSKKQPDLKSDRIPEWLLSADSYTPPADKEAFLNKTILSLLAKLSHLRQNNIDTGFANHISPAFILFFIFMTAVLTVASVKIVFPLFVLASILVYLACQKASKIISVLKPALTACIFTAIIMLPSLLLNNARFIFLPLKVFITVSLLSCMSQSVPFSAQSHALRHFNVPSVFILVIDLTLKYIVLLGTTATNLLTSMKLRSVGKNNEKYNSMASIMGTTFLKSQHYSQYTYDAMRCRCFTGEYKAPNHRLKLRPVSIIYLLILLLLLASFLILEGYL